MVDSHPAASPASQEQQSARPDSAGSRPSISPDANAVVNAVVNTVVLDDAAIRRSLVRIAHEIVERHSDLSVLYLVAIPNGGVPLGRILQRNLESIAGVELPLGILDTTLYRDDLTRNGVRPPLRLTEMPSSVDDRIVLVVEDVVSTGRTIRAAMDAMIDFGRPTGVQVVALVDRGHRELPIKIDYVGKNIPTSRDQQVDVRIQETDGRDEVVVLDAEPAEDTEGRDR